ncbi:MAG: plasmid pRiA4b ORF-3 family protein [Candidatus Dormibacteraeota bacterium]|nr:plasmid pRiA4b ORF-3 family protein [Candidatus Dormibacteraeota bacterium]
MTTTDGRSQGRRGGREILIPTQALILRFRIELQDSDPLVWRAIEVPGDYTFWDLHVAIQDAMGWLDYHLHRFTLPHPRTRQERVFGIHNLSADCDDPPGWAHQIAALFTVRNATAVYLYDFGDGWRHTVRLVAMVRRDFTRPYPRCVAGERACPPEDCGGIPGFSAIVTGLRTGNLDKETRAWLPQGYDPARFDPGGVRFSNPARRLAYSWYGDPEAGEAPFGE